MAFYDIAVLGDVWVPHYFRSMLSTHALLMEWIGEESSLFFSLDLGPTVNTMAGFYNVFFYVNCYRFSSYREKDCIGALIFHLAFGIHRLLTFPAPSLDYSRRKFKIKKKRKRPALFYSLGLSITGGLLLSPSFRTFSYLRYIFLKCLVEHEFCGTSIPSPQQHKPELWNYF